MATPTTSDLAWRLTDYKDLASIVDVLIKLVALSVGAFWSRRLFGKKREGKPRAALILHASEFRVPGEMILVRVAATVENKGAYLLPLITGYARAEQLAPCSEQEIKAWRERTNPASTCDPEVRAPQLKKLTFCPATPVVVEPGESETMNFDFVIRRGTTRLMKVEVFLSNVEESKNLHHIGWSAQTIVELKFCKKPTNGGTTDGERGRSTSAGTGAATPGADREGTSGAT